MLASDVPVFSLAGKSPRFWHLRISRDFDKPKYFIGQTVLHKIQVRQGEILHPVELIGISWTGIDWQYSAKLPDDHPWFRFEDNEVEWLDEHQIEAM